MVTAPVCTVVLGKPCETTGTDWLWGVHGCRCYWLRYLREVGHPLPAGLIICAISGWFCFSSRILVISRVKAAGSSTSAFASASGLSRTMAMSISPPSFWMRPVRLASVQGSPPHLFSHRVRSHSSRALCAKVPVCGGAFELPVSPMHG